MRFVWLVPRLVCPKRRQHVHFLSLSIHALGARLSAQRCGSCWLTRAGRMAGMCGHAAHRPEPRCGLVHEQQACPRLLDTEQRCRHVEECDSASTPGGPYGLSRSAPSARHSLCRSLLPGRASQVLLPPITHHRSPVNCQPAVRAGTVDGGCQALPFNANNIRSTQLRSARACWQAGAVAVRLLGTPGVLWCSGAPRPKLGWAAAKGRPGRPDWCGRFVYSQSRAEGRMGGQGCSRGSRYTKSEQSRAHQPWNIPQPLPMELS